MRKCICILLIFILAFTGCSPKTVSIELSETYLEIEKDSKYILTCKIVPEENNYTWSSTNESVAIVTDGKIYALQEGKTTIVVKSEDGNSDSCEVVVKISGPTEEEKLDELCSELATTGAYGIRYDMGQKMFECRADIASGSTYEDVCIVADYYPGTWAQIINSAEGIPQTIYKCLCALDLSDWKVCVNFYVDGYLVAYAQTDITGTTSSSYI